MPAAGAMCWFESSGGDEWWWTMTADGHLGPEQFKAKARDFMERTDGSSFLQREGLLAMLLREMYSHGLVDARKEKPVEVAVKQYPCRTCMSPVLRLGDICALCYVRGSNG